MEINPTIFGTVSIFFKGEAPMKYLLGSFLFLVYFSGSPVLAANIFSKCTIVISNIGSPSTTTCNSIALLEKCITESPGEPKLCSLTGKQKLQNGTVQISAEFMNGFLSLWIDAGDKNWMVSRVAQQALIMPLDYDVLIRVRTPSQVVTEEKAFISCAIFQEQDSNRECK
jgi:hypothetical protein